MCQRDNPAHHRICLGCGFNLRKASAQNIDASPIVPMRIEGALVPVSTPRQIQAPVVTLWRLHKLNWAMAIILNILFFPVGVFIFLPSFMASYKVWKLLRRGQLVRGRVEQVIDGSSSVTFSVEIRFVWGDREHRFDQDVHRRLMDKVVEGMPVEVIFDRRRVERAICPALAGVDFQSPEPIEDVRPNHVAAVDDGSPPRDQRLLIALHRARPRKAASLRRWLSRGGSAGVLELDGDGVRVGKEGRIRWSSPFVVQPSVWLLEGGAAVLSVTLRQGEARVRFQVEVPQSSVSRSVSIQQVDAPWMGSDDFARVWPWIAHFAAIHGDPVRGVGRLGQMDAR